YTNKEGYVRVAIDPSDPMISMASWKRTHTATVLEHRLVVARAIGRPLLDHETVHHKDGNRQNNAPGNLELRVGPHGKGATHEHCGTCRCFVDKRVADRERFPEAFAWVA